VVDTVGAGDNFDAGFLYGMLERGMTVLDGARFANAAAARSCMFRGGTGSCSKASDIDAFVEEDK